MLQRAGSCSAEQFWPGEGEGEGEGEGCDTSIATGNIAFDNGKANECPSNGRL